MLPSTYNRYSSFLFPLSILYGWAISLRNTGFDSGFFKQHKLPRPVISVGNLTVGGTGKTPVTCFLADILNERDLEVALLTRGYGRISSRPVKINKDNLSEIGFSITGDEARILADRLKRGAVYIDSNRYRAGRRAMAESKPDVFVLDDGFQHRNLKRDLNIVTIDAASPFGNGRLLPSGNLRESPTQLKRGDLLWVTRADEANAERKEIQEKLSEFSQSPIIFSNHIVSGLIQCKDWREVGFGALRGREVFAFCGIAKPDSFRRILVNNDMQIVDFKIFSDHHRYTSEDLRDLEKRAAEVKSDVLITTEKDAARISPNSQGIMSKLFFPRISIDIASGMTELKKSLKDIDIW